MSMSTHVVGYRAPDKWDRMKAAWNACRAAGVAVPKDVDSFFNGENPNTARGVEVPISSAVTPFKDVALDGYDVDVTKLPKDVTVIRFYNSW